MRLNNSDCGDRGTVRCKEAIIWEGFQKSRLDIGHIMMIDYILLYFSHLPSLRFYVFAKKHPRIQALLSETNIDNATC